MASKSSSSNKSVFGIDVNESVETNSYCFSAPFLASLSSDSVRSEYVDLLRYLFVEWATRDTHTASAPLAVRHAQFQRELQVWLARSDVMSEAATMYPHADRRRRDRLEAFPAPPVRGKRARAHAIVDDLTLPAVRLMAEQRVDARYAMSRSVRYRPRAGAVALAVMRSSLAASFMLLAVQDVSALRGGGGSSGDVASSSSAAQAPPSGVSFVVVNGAQVATCDTATTVRVQLPFATTLPTTLAAWRVYVRDAATRLDQTTRCEYDRAFAVLCPRSRAVHCVMLTNFASCTCEENAREWQQCVHLMFVLVHVLRVPLSDHMLYQRAWVRDERYAAYMRRATLEQMSDRDWRLAGERVGERRPLPLDSECRVCFAACSDADAAATPFCRSCGRSYHAECLRQWRSHQDAELADRCPICLGAF